MLTRWPTPSLIYVANQQVPRPQRASGSWQTCGKGERRPWPVADHWQHHGPRLQHHLLFRRSSRALPATSNGSGGRYTARVMSSRTKDRKPSKGELARATCRNTVSFASDTGLPWQDHALEGWTSRGPPSRTRTWWGPRLWHCGRGGVQSAWSATSWRAQLDRQADKQKGRQTNRQAGRQSNGQARQPNKQEGKQPDRQAGKGEDKLPDKQIGRQVGRQANNHTGRQRDRDKHIHTERVAADRHSNSNWQTSKFVDRKTGS